jgi:hypothetical protein
MNPPPTLALLLESIRYNEFPQRYWVFGLCPSSGFFLNNNEKTQRFGNWICFRTQVKGETPTLLGPLERANLNHLNPSLV